MCLTPEALALFLNLLNPDIIEAESGQITIHATANKAVWVLTGDHWCTDAPDQDKAARL
ncbi:hypothetical protein TG4357_00614 [Thalassovita gelatinovora]|uniref:Uncharacterized protein n=1 Tax=Thalassovita gelatinovora TaxID=53501 RepID=A0A0P1FTM1_THAGE|nr:hypothetical protein [Thalassovita gelatinovora]QIZ80878.1 hypothetical protein HFZ77_10540 [Thalassovita gelatinovora]CUH63340.1 hypothetical protein TG4357_00614 [Thalassovita gelatinovora]SEQ65428.1 hypothetical protein SAMN04488043_107117 [Thalassovita gelatinovora]